MLPLTAGLAWDWISQKLYWTDYCDDDIEVYDPTSGARRVLFDLDLESPYGIVIDPINGYVQPNEYLNQARQQINFLLSDFKHIVS